MTTILAVDPGGMTGYVVYDVGQQPAPVPAEKSFEDFLDSVDHWFAGRYATSEPVTVVCERFTIGPDTAKKSRGDTHWSIETIGVLRHLCRRFEFPFVLQNVADAKKLATNQLLRDIGWWARGQDHGRDALRHLVLWLAGNRPDVFKLLVQPA